MLTKRPLATKMMTAFLLGNTGDLICQYMERKYSTSTVKDWDIIRAIRQGTIASLFMSSTIHFYLTRFVPLLTFGPGTFKNQRIASLATFSLKYLFHIFIWMPAHQTLFFFAMGLVRH